ncbi:MAG: MmcQ/YjbR family DNA-binding protein [Clostridia bacterium]|nr:MmcQ/YjbR family DNA-binding protein [Clostridia bacterium]
MTREELKSFIKNQYGVISEVLWPDEPGFEVFRHPCGKWFGVVMNIDGTKIGEKEGEIDVLNVKCDPMLLDILVQKTGYKRGYHMNKRLWLTILLDLVDERDVKGLVCESYDLVTPKKDRKKAR